MQWSNFPSRGAVLGLSNFRLTKLTQILYDMDYFVCFSFRTRETSHEICNDSQMYDTII